MEPEFEKLEAAIGYRFSNRDLLRRALTHASHAYETDARSVGDNERLEFLGDAVLGFLASEYLIHRYPGFREGELSIAKNYLVSASHLHQVALRLELGRHLLLGRGEEMSGGRTKAGLLANALEALIAAIYLDGGMEAARAFAAREVFRPEALSAGDADIPAANYKGILQQTARALNLPAPRYTVVSEEGPPHAPRFTVEVRVGEQWVAQGEGASKKSASQKAAQAVLQQLLRDHAPGDLGSCRPPRQ